MIRMDFPLKHKEDAVRQGKFEPSYYSSVDVHTPPLASDLADTAPTIIPETRLEKPLPTTRTTTAST